MSKVIDFNSVKTNKEKTESDISDQELHSYEYVFEDIIKMSKSHNIVATDEIEARLIAKALMADDPNIHYCVFEGGLSRMSYFITIKPIMRTEESKELLFLPRSYRRTYVKHLQDNNLITDDGFNILD